MSGAQPAHDAARIVWDHWHRGSVLASLPEACRPRDRAAGYAVQAALGEVNGQALLGWKIAATSAGGQAHIGVSGPLAGRLFAGGVVAEGQAVQLRTSRMRVAEPEFAFRMGRTLAPRAKPYTPAEVVAAAATLHPAIEIPDSRFEPFVAAGEAQLLADDACAWRFVLGRPTDCDWRAIDLASHPVRARITSSDGLTSTREGTGAAVLGDPRIALAWIANELSSLGIALETGMVVTTGTCMQPLDVRPGDAVDADYGPIGRVRVRFSA